MQQLQVCKTQIPRKNPVKSCRLGDSISFPGIIKVFDWRYQLEQPKTRGRVRIVVCLNCYVSGKTLTQPRPEPYPMEHCTPGQRVEGRDSNRGTSDRAPNVKPLKTKNAPNTPKTQMHQVPLNFAKDILISFLMEKISKTFLDIFSNLFFQNGLMFF